MKTCSQCRQTKPLTEFYRNRNRPDGFAHQCKVCRNAYDTTRTRTDRPAYARKAYHRVKADIFDILGRTCVMCDHDGSIYRLEIDHIDGDGAVHRATTDIRTYYRQILASVRAGSDAYRTLCAYCNISERDRLASERAFPPPKLHLRVVA